MRRRLQAVMLFAAVVAPLRAAGAKEQEVVLWHAYRAGEAEALEASVQHFRKAHPEIVVRSLAVPAGAYAQKLCNAIPYGHGPDLFIAAHDRLGDFVARRLIDRLPVSASLDRFLPETRVPLHLADGGAWGWPMAYKSLVLYYRTDKIALPPRTTAELVSMGHSLQGTETYALAYELGDPFYHAAWVHGFGGHYLGKDGQVATVDSPELHQAGAFLHRLAQIEKIVPVDVNGHLVTELFNRGHAAMVLSGPWLLTEIAAGVPYAIAPLPVVSATGKPARPFLSVEALFLARGRLRPEVLALAAAITSDEAASLRARRARQPVANAAVYTEAEVIADPVLMAFRQQLSTSVPMPTASLMSFVWEPVAEGLRQITRGSRTPEQAMRESQQRIEMLARGLPPVTSWLPYLIALILVATLLVWLLWRQMSMGLGTRIYRARQAYLFLAPTVIGMLLVVGIPVAMGFGVGFFAFGPSEKHFVGLANFVNILAAEDYPPTHPLSFYFTLIVTILWTGINVTMHVVFGFAVAMLLTPTWLRGRGLFRVLLILPWAVPNYITALIFKGLFNSQLGAVNAILAGMGIEPVGWFESFLPAFCANLTTNVWLGFPFMMVTVLGALQAIPGDLYEAARVDGASPWRRFRTITMPLVAPALLPAVILGSIWTFNQFNVVFLVSEGQPEGATDILITEAYRWAFKRNNRYGYAAAYSVVIFFILLLYNTWTQRLTRRAMEAKV